MPRPLPFSEGASESESDFERGVRHEWEAANFAVRMAYDAVTHDPQLDVGRDLLRRFVAAFDDALISNTFRALEEEAAWQASGLPPP
jgi:hypothetical protein